MSTRCIRTREIAVIAEAAIFFVFAANARGAHSAYVAWAQDPLNINFYVGTSNPGGSRQINVVSSVPGYLNSISGGLVGSSIGDITVSGASTTNYVGLAIHLTDTAGPSHSLSTLSDPALADIVFDLNHPSISGTFTITAYPYNAAPQQYASAEAVLSAGEAANGGQPFDILLTATYAGPTAPSSSVMELNFGNELVQLDGISALGVTDIGIVPEPAGAALLATLAAPILLARRRRA